MNSMAGSYLDLFVGCCVFSGFCNLFNFSFCTVRDFNMSFQILSSTTSRNYCAKLFAVKSLVNADAIQDFIAKSRIL